jgi:hypothetical protein
MFIVRPGGGRAAGGRRGQANAAGGSELKKRAPRI